MAIRMSDFQAVIFDSDGVLVDSEIIHIAVERELLSELGLQYDHTAYLSRFVGLSNTDFYHELSKDFAEQVGGNFPESFGKELQARTWPKIETELKPIEGIEDFIKSLAQPVAVASSAPIEKLQRKLEITGLGPLFAPHIYSVDHVTRGKPAPDLFLYAAEALEIDPHRCLVVEDSAHGIKAARAAGMTPIGFVGGGHVDDGLPSRLKDCGAEIVVTDYAKLLALI